MSRPEAMPDLRVNDDDARTSPHLSTRCDEATRRFDGHLESRAMANQKRADGADLWFVTAEGTGKDYK